MRRSGARVGADRVLGRRVAAQQLDHAGAGRQAGQAVQARVAEVDVERQDAHALGGGEAAEAQRQGALAFLGQDRGEEDHPALWPRQRLELEGGQDVAQGLGVARARLLDDVVLGGGRLAAGRQLRHQRQRRQAEGRLDLGPAAEAAVAALQEVRAGTGRAPGRRAAERDQELGRGKVGVVGGTASEMTRASGSCMPSSSARLLARSTSPS